MIQSMKLKFPSPEIVNLNLPLKVEVTSSTPIAAEEKTTRFLDFLEEPDVSRISYTFDQKLQTPVKMNSDLGKHKTFMLSKNAITVC